MTDRTLNMKIKQLEALEAQKKDIDAAISQIKDSIQKSMGDAEELTTNHYIIRWTKIISNKLDTKAFKAEMPGLFQKFSKETESRRFSYTAL